MKLVIEVPDEYVEAVRQRLAGDGWNDAPNQVRRVLRYVVSDHLTRWYRTRHRWLWRVFDVERQRLTTVMPVTAYGDVERNEPGGAQNAT